MLVVEKDAIQKVRGSYLKGTKQIIEDEIDVGVGMMEGIELVLFLE
jgi:hypothetical protein